LASIHPTVLHSTASSAAICSVSGTVRPSALAVLMLIASLRVLATNCSGDYSITSKGAEAAFGSAPFQPPRPARPVGRWDRAGSAAYGRGRGAAGGGPARRALCAVRRPSAVG